MLVLVVLLSGDIYLFDYSDELCFLGYQIIFFSTVG